MDNDHEIPPVRGDQSMAVAATMVAGLIGSFGRPEDDEEMLGKHHLVLLSTFLFQLLMCAKQKEKVAQILEAIIVELRDGETQQPPK